ncbi:transmembrane and death domain protein 1-like [Podarcis raffonei]|uniref:transmembrane and death domain protein 1-like n=1 Tax=Podarcis raffonei TaxID=65483 RepID=UPI0023298C68|nr:transmembrane and death domain protein 1-like [Podarcis raffonei]
MLALTGLPLFLLASQMTYIKMAAHDPEATVLGCVSELLNPEECHELYIRLATPQKDAQQPSEEGDLYPAGQREGISDMDQCKEGLKQWLQLQRGAIDWDRLARALRQIGRPDVSRELKKSLNKNRSLEPKWDAEGNRTVVMGAQPSALLVENKAPTRRSRYRPIHKHHKTFAKEGSWDLKAFLLQLFPVALQNLTLQQCVLPAARLLVVSFLAGLVLWLISVYYVICWNLGQCLFASGLRYGATPARQNMNLTVIWNNQAVEDTIDDEEDPDSSLEEDATEDEQ